MRLESSSVVVPLQIPWPDLSISCLMLWLLEFHFSSSTFIFPLSLLSWLGFPAWRIHSNNILYSLDYFFFLNKSDLIISLSSSQDDSCCCVMREIMHLWLFMGLKYSLLQLIRYNGFQWASAPLNWMQQRPNMTEVSKSNCKVNHCMSNACVKYFATFHVSVLCC